MKCLVCNVAFYLYGAQTTPSQPTYWQHQTQPIASTIGNYTSIIMKCLVCNVAFYLYGAQTTPSQPTYWQHQTQPIASTIGSPKFSPRQMSTPMTIRGPQGQMQPGKLNQSYQQPLNQSYQSPNQSVQSPYQNVMSPGFNQSSFNVTQQPRDPNFSMQAEYSAKHNALYIYIGRILAPIWNLKCVSKSSTPDKKEFLVSRLSSGECAHTVGRLQRAAALVLCEHQFHVIAAALPPDQQQALQAASFRELLVGGQEVACLLLGSLVAGYLRDNASVDGISQKLRQLCPTLYRQEDATCSKELLVGGQEVACLLLGSLVAGYLRDNASVDGISQKLRQLCPTLYRQEDATCSKANELLIFAKQQKNPAEREEMLQHALKLCVDVAPNVNLPLVCSKLISVGFYTGVVELCVACAAKIDPQDKAIHYYKSDQPQQDREGHIAYYRRMEIYREVCGALERLYERSSESANDSCNAINSSTTDASSQGRKLVWECLSRNDELLHVAVYEWLVSKNLGSELLSLGTAPPPSLRTYLLAASRSAPAPASLHLLDLLWKVLEKCGDHLAAADVLEGLATRPG
ncbi:hypothetical protein NE865_14195 [Phthorimaea operculella]|nr:hypothetical protein NE865_14195 [Phthorimaea operculella]